MNNILSQFLHLFIHILMDFEFYGPLYVITILGNTFIIIIKDFLDSLNSSFLGSCLIPFNHDLLSLEYLGTQPSQVPGYS